jgi:hypothetical protein
MQSKWCYLSVFSTTSLPTPAAIGYKYFLAFKNYEQQGHRFLTQNPSWEDAHDLDLLE